jgi:hypothetical protein
MYLSTIVGVGFDVGIEGSATVFFFEKCSHVAADEHPQLFAAV